MINFPTDFFCHSCLQATFKTLRMYYTEWKTYQMDQNIIWEKKLKTSKDLFWDRNVVEPWHMANDIYCTSRIRSCTTNVI